MKKFLMGLIAVLFVSQTHAAVLVFSPNGTYTTKTDLSTASTATDAVGKAVVVTSALTFTSMSTATGAWPADRKLKIEKGGSINTSHTFRIKGPFEAGAYQVFTGTGQVSFGAGMVTDISPHWFGTGTAAVQKALDAAHASALLAGSSSSDPKLFTVRVPSGFVFTASSLTHYLDTVLYDDTPFNGPAVYIGEGDAEYKIIYPNLDNAANNAPYLTLWNQRTTKDRTKGITFKHASANDVDWQIAAGRTDGTTWAANTAYAASVRVISTDKNDHIYICTTPGTSGATEPTWPTVTRATVADGTAVWTEDGAWWVSDMVFYSYPNQRNRLLLGGNGAIILNAPATRYDAIKELALGNSYILGKSVSAPNNTDHTTILYSGDATAVNLDFRSGSDGKGKRISVDYTTNFMWIYAANKTNKLLGIGDDGTIRIPNGNLYTYANDAAAVSAGIIKKGDLYLLSTGALMSCLGCAAP